MGYVLTDNIVNLVLDMYADEPCRICGKMITKEQVKDTVFAGYSLDNKSRFAHGSCWKSNVPKSEWAYLEEEAKQ